MLEIDMAAFMDAYQTPGRGGRGCPKGVCREGSGYVASIRLNKKQQKGPVRSTVSEATRDRAQMLFMKATRSGSEVELWINSLKRKKRKNKQSSNSPDDQVASHSADMVGYGGDRDNKDFSSTGFYSPESDIFNTQDVSRQQQQQQLSLALDQFLEQWDNDNPCEGLEFLCDCTLTPSDLLKSIQDKQAQMQLQQVQILREIMLVQQEIFL
jgi:hypothetical protein